MFGNFNGMIQMCQQMMNSGNPAQFISQRFGVDIPQGMNNPNDIIQHFVNNGRFSQQQVNQIMNMRNNPMLQQFFGRRY